MDLILNNKSKHGNSKALSGKIGLKDLERCPPYLNFDWCEISSKIKVTIEDVLEHQMYKWDWSCLSRNPHITLQEILRYPHLNWDWTEISRNPSITFEDVMQYPDKPWDWYVMSYNSMEYGKKRFIRNWIKMRLLIKQVARQTKKLPLEVFDLVASYL